jgi:hypothetical protein
MRQRPVVAILAILLLAVSVAFFLRHSDSECQPRALTQAEIRLIDGVANVSENGSMFIRTYNGNSGLTIKSVTIQVDDLPNSQRRRYRESIDIRPLAVSLISVRTLLQHTDSKEWSFAFVEGLGCEGS